MAYTEDSRLAESRRVADRPRADPPVPGPQRLEKGTQLLLILAASPFCSAVTTLARERRYIDNLGSIQWSEFTVYQSLCFPAAVYPVLAKGGKWDETKDSSTVPQK